MELQITYELINIRSLSGISLRCLYSLLVWKDDIHYQSSANEPQSRLIQQHLSETTASLCFRTAEDWRTYAQQVTHENNTMQRATRTSPFKLIIPREPPTTSIAVRLSGPRNDIHINVTPKHSPHKLLLRIELIEAASSSRLSRAQWRYKCCFEKNLRRKRTFRVGD